MGKQNVQAEKVYCIEFCFRVQERKWWVTFVKLRQLQISTNSVQFSLDLEMGNRT